MKELTTDKIDFREISFICERDYFTEKDLKQLRQAYERDIGSDPNLAHSDMRYRFVPRYDLSGNPWELHVTYEREKRCVDELTD